MSLQWDRNQTTAYSDRRVYPDDFYHYPPVTARRARRFERATDYADRAFLGCVGGWLFALIVNVIVSIG